MWPKRLEEEVEHMGNEDLRPTTVIYNSVMDAWAKSGDPKAPEHVEAILDRMHARSI